MIQSAPHHLSTLLLIVIIACCSLPRAVVGVIPLDFSNIDQAVIDWLADENAATIKWGHISDWDTSNIKDMNSLFCHTGCGTARNKGDAVLTFNVDLSKWNVDKVSESIEMFKGAAAFSQQLFCDGSWESSILLPSNFDGTSVTDFTCGDNKQFRNININQAVKDWLADETAAAIKWGHNSENSEIRIFYMYKKIYKI